MALKAKCSEKKNIYACFLHSHYFCCKRHIEFREIVWNICLYKCSLKNAGSKIDVSLCVAALRGDVRRGRGDSDTAVLLSRVQWPSYGLPLVHWITSRSSQCVWFLYLLACMWELESVCVYMCDVESVSVTQHWPLPPLLEKVSLGNFAWLWSLTPCLPRGPCSFAESTQRLRCSTYTHVMSALEFSWSSIPNIYVSAVC